MIRLLSRGVLTLRFSYNIRPSRYSVPRWTAAPYHATSRLCSESRVSDVKLCTPRPLSRWNRPCLLNAERVTYNRDRPDDEAFKEAFDYYVSRWGKEVTHVLLPLWFGRTMAMAQGITPRQEAQACLACAEHARPDQYPKIYYDTDSLADALYILGRTDLERDSKHRKAARFSLDHAAELGHVDAVLLLHRLTMADTSISIGSAAERIIRGPMKEVEWALMAAYLERTRLKDVDQMKWIDVMETIQLLEEAVELHINSRGLSSAPHQTRKPVVLGDTLDVDAMGSFDPPARYLWQLCRYHYPIISAQKESDRRRINALYDKALRIDAKDNDNIEARYELATLPREWRSLALTTHSRLWAVYVQQAAEACIPEAMLNFGFYLLHETSVYPTSAMTTGRYQPSIPTNIELQHHQLAFEQLKQSVIAFSTERPDIIGCLYIIMAGILSENGFHQEGHEYIQESHRHIERSISSPRCDRRKKERFRKLMQELDNSWHKYKETGLYDDIRPKQMLKNPAIAEILMLPD